MSDELVTIRVSKQLKRKMKKSQVNWSQELRDTIERKLASENRRDAASELDSILVSIRPGFHTLQAIKETRRSA